MSPITLSAPGKMMVAGEYAVLHGHEAIVCAVSRRLRLELVTKEATSTNIPPEAREAAKEAANAIGSDAAFSLAIDATPLRQGDTKLGLGSSAAAAAAAAAALYARGGLDLNDAAIRDAVFEAADRGHRAIAPKGSGADVCASVYGGWRRFRRQGGMSRSEALAPPKSLHIRVIWTGHAARTSDFLTKVDTLATLEPAIFRQRIHEIHESAEHLISSLQNNDVAESILAVQAHHTAMAALGDASSAPIVEARLQAIANLATQSGGAAKPSGAGGGDVALAFFASSEDASRFVKACGAEGFQEVPLLLGEPGVRIESASNSP